MKNNITDQMLCKMRDALMSYMSAKTVYDNHILDNDKWFKSEHWDEIRGNSNNTDMREPITGFLFNAIAFKHAEAMDYYPVPRIIEREQRDVDEAKSLSQLIEFEMENTNFRQVYSSAWWYKLKNGTCAYGVFFNPDSGDCGDIDILRLDLLNVFWEPGISDIQQSKYLFITNLVDKEYINAKYPKSSIEYNNNSYIKAIPKHYGINHDDKYLVVDCYYKKYVDGKSIVCLTKFIGDTVLDSTENYPETARDGLYAHGMYPIVLDVMYPVDGAVTGFGLIDIAKNPQTYIDKLDYIISENALVSGKMRWLVKDGSGINEDELMNVASNVIHVNGSLREENIKQFQARPLSPYIMEHRARKISELKEVIGNRDFNQGNTANGVTAYSAIVALQEAGNKLSRDMINESYEAYRQIIYMCIELIRQFFDEERKFRITGENGTNTYLKYSNKHIKGNKAIFDIKVRAEKSSPFSRLSQNETALELYKLGFFNPQMAEQSLLALDIMDFEGKEKLFPTKIK